MTSHPRAHQPPVRLANLAIFHYTPYEIDRYVP